MRFRIFIGLHHSDKHDCKIHRVLSVTSARYQCWAHAKLLWGLKGPRMLFRVKRRSKKTSKLHATGLCKRILREFCVDVILVLHRLFRSDISEVCERQISDDIKKATQKGLKQHITKRVLCFALFWWCYQLFLDLRDHFYSNPSMFLPWDRKNHMVASVSVKGSRCLDLGKLIGSSTQRNTGKGELFA